MPRSLGSGIPPALAARLDGRDLQAKVGDTYLLATVSEDGWPHVAMLSAGEVVAHGETVLRLGLWPGTHSTANLQRDGQALLVAVLPPATYYVRLRCRTLGEVPVEDRTLAAFEAEVTEALEDVVGYARVTEGIRFELNEPARILRHWAAALAAVKGAGADTQADRHLADS